MFHFPTFPPHTLCVQVQVTGHDSSWVSPFGHPRITARLPTPRGLSQAPTSFIGSWCQGIHHVPLVACHTTKRLQTNKTNNTIADSHPQDARVHCVVLKRRATPSPTPTPTPAPRTSHPPPTPTGANNRQPPEHGHEYAAGTDRRNPHRTPPAPHRNQQHPTLEVSGPNSVPGHHPHPRSRFHTHPTPAQHQDKTSSTDEHETRVATD